MKDPRKTLFDLAYSKLNNEFFSFSNQNSSTAILEFPDLQKPLKWKHAFIADADKIIYYEIDMNSPVSHLNINFNIRRNAWAEN